MKSTDVPASFRSLNRVNDEIVEDHESQKDKRRENVHAFENCVLFQAK